MCNAYTWGPGGCDRKNCVGGVRCYLKSSTLGWRSQARPSPQNSGFFCKDSPKDSALVAGPLSYVTYLPRGTEFIYLVTPLAAHGITAAVDKWGHALRAVYKLQRVPQGLTRDPVGTQLGYWTDNVS